MDDVLNRGSPRRAFLAGVAAGGLLLLPGCASVANFSTVEVIRRLLEHATRNAFARLTAPDGFWNSAVARIDMPVLFGKRAGLIKGILSSDAFREKLQKQLNNIAEDGARKAAPVVAEAVRTIGIANAVDLLKGGPTAATSFLRAEMGTGLVNAMIPELDKAMRIVRDPILAQAIAALTGVNLGDAAHGLALDADNAIWFEIGAAEAQIRANPEATNDAVLIAGLKAL